MTRLIHGFGGNFRKFSLIVSRSILVKICAKYTYQQETFIFFFTKNDVGMYVRKFAMVGPSRFLYTHTHKKKDCENCHAGRHFRIFISEHVLK